VQFLATPSAASPDDRGSVTVEAAIVLPLLVLLLGLLIAVGRVTLAGSVVDSAAKAAARQVSLSRTPTSALADADRAARAALEQGGLNCVSVSVEIDTSHISPPAGTSGSVKATVSCTVALDDVAIPGLPGRKTMTSTFTSPVDRYRQKSGGSQ
jgi:Flp pilus assembly protein TadG